jgi:LmbE family N-acetylglucosaminyl deacetylase
MAQSPKALDGAELKLAVEKLSVLGSVLYVGAHPDDENTAFLAFMAKGKLVRTGYLSMTRGEGGQNLIGPEQGDELGVIRTQELLAARRVDGAEQFFTRALDFGYSKTSEETMKIWDNDKILSDVVWIVRNFRPDVIVTRFTPTIGGHGNHTSSAILAEEAFNASGDPGRFPEQLKYVKPWKAKRLMFNSARFFDAALDTATAIKVDLGEFSPILGRSYSEIAGIGRSNHKSQGFGAPQRRGSGFDYFVLSLGDKPGSSLFDGIDLTWSRVTDGNIVGATISDLQKQFDCQNPAASLPLLLKAYAEMGEIHDNEWVEIKKEEIKEVIRSCAGLWLDALASDYSAIPGGEVKVTFGAINRSHEPIRIDSVAIPYSTGSFAKGMLPFNIPVQEDFVVHVPDDFRYSTQYWLRETPDKGSYNISDYRLIGLAENKPPLSAVVYLTVRGQQLAYNVPVRYRSVDPVEGELYRPFVVVPPVALNLEEKVYVFSSDAEKEIRVVLKGGTANAIGTVRLELPKGWSTVPATIPFVLKNKNDEKVIGFAVRASRSATSGAFAVEAEVGGKKMTQGLTTIRYSHIPPQTMLSRATGKLVRLDLTKNGDTVGYIMGAGDEVPTALRQMGYQVTLLSDDELANSDLSHLDVIIAGVRAYNTRPSARIYQNRLMEYARNGGTYIVQYMTPQRRETEDIGPYQLNVSRDRITVEEAPPVFVNPKSPLLNFPNKITDADFNGWVQERGLSFANGWDARYDTAIAFADPGESPKSGGLLYTQYGKGYYVYTGLAFFRQLPAGVPGAYRFFSNILSIGKEAGLRKMPRAQDSK